MPDYRFAVARYVPGGDQDADFVNVGVIVAGPDTFPGLEARFLRQKDREVLNGRELELPLDLISDIEGDLLGHDSAEPWDLVMLERASSEWEHEIRFSSLEEAKAPSAEELLEELYGRYIALEPYSSVTR